MGTVAAVVAQTTIRASPAPTGRRITHEDEEAHGFQSFDRRVGKAAVEIVDEHDALVDAGLLRDFQPVDAMEASR